MAFYKSVARRARNLAGISQVLDELAALRRQLGALEQRIADRENVEDLRYRDVLAFVGEAWFTTIRGYRLDAERAVAYDSDDHKSPLGTVNDNTRSLRFVAACERTFQERLSALDIGCAGGGLVLDFLLRGHDAVGLEGSDVNLRTLRAEWRLLPRNLFTCDATRRFDLYDLATNEPARFHVVTAWELMEHIEQRDLPALLTNVSKHLRDEGLFVGSIATFPCDDPVTGAVYHRTIQPRDWWRDCFREHGLEMTDEHQFAFRDFVRGTGNGWMDTDLSKQPELGFHFVARKAPR